MIDATAILERLRRPDGPAAELAALLVADALARPLAELVPAAELTAAVAEGLLAATASPGAERKVADLLERALVALAAEPRPLAELVPAPLQAGARAIVELPFAPPRERVLELLDRPPIRRMLRRHVLQTLSEFARKAAAPITENPIARGLGGLGKRALGGFGAAVSAELERQAERRAAEFADTAVSEILAGVADELADPAHARMQAEVRVAVLEGALELSGAEAGALLQPQLGPGVAIARRAAGAWAAEPGFVATVARALEALVAADAARPLGEVLDEIGVRAVAAARATAALRRHIDAVVATDGFARWLAALVG